MFFVTTASYVWFQMSFQVLKFQEKNSIAISYFPLCNIVHSLAIHSEWIVHAYILNSTAGSLKNAQSI